MKLILLISLINVFQFLPSKATECNYYTTDGMYYYAPDVCFSKRVNGSLISQIYSCISDSTIEYKEFRTNDSVHCNDTRLQIFNTTYTNHTELYELHCSGKLCAAVLRTYVLNSTENANNDNCDAINEATNDYYETPIATHTCVDYGDISYYWECSSTSVSYRYYGSSDYCSSKTDYITYHYEGCDVNSLAFYQKKICNHLLP